MIAAYFANNPFKLQEINETNLALLPEALWLDLINPSKVEENWVEQYSKVEIPTPEEMREIELSSRLYTEDDILYMTATMVAHSDSLNPQFDAVTFAITPTQLITIRYIEPQAFKLFSNLLLKTKNKVGVIELFIWLLEVAVDRLADVLEYIGHHLDDYSNNIFQYDRTNKAKERLNYQLIMQNIGIKSNLNNKARESLVNFSRLMTFFLQTADARIDKEGKVRLATLVKDLGSISDYANFISNKINFLLDATLGMIDIEQSAIIKIFSVAAVIFLPPTLIASIYGMNFRFMPELDYKWGYWMAIGIMIISAWLPYKYFKYRRWL